MKKKFLSPILTLNLPLAKIIHQITELPLASQPGTTWHYSLANDILGYLIGLISGTPCDVFLHKRIFEPLGMDDTGFFVPPGKLDRFGSLYGSPDENGLPVLDDVNSSPFVRSDIVLSGGGGLVSSMPDYYRFMSMLANGGELDGVRVLKRSTVSQMTTNQLTGPAIPMLFDNDIWPDMGYGLGIGVQVTDSHPVGWYGASGTSAWIFPREEMIVIAMPQIFGDMEASDTLLIMAQEAKEV